MAGAEEVFTDSDGDKLKIWADPGEERATLIAISRYDTYDRQSVYVHKDDAPAVALAILEGSGYSGDALAALRADIAVQAALKGRKRLEEAALALLNTLRTSNGYSGKVIDALPGDAIDAWLNVARKAEQIFGGKDE